MPLYSYKCLGSDGHRFERQRRMAERNDPITCPSCGEPAKLVPQAPVLAWSPASAEGGRSNYRERVRIPDTD